MFFKTIQGSAHDVPEIADKSVQLICTSPPYLGLRSYDGDQAIEWPTVEYAPMPGLPPITISAQRAALGLEKDPFAYIGHLILCLREWRRVLRDDGLAFVNLSDTYSSGSMTPHGGQRKDRNQSGMSGIARNGFASLPPKNLMQIPQRFALAAQADGWYLRSAMPWIKRNGMPESVTDRPATVIESIFMLAKSERYFFDAEAVKMPVAESSIGRLSQDVANQNGSARANGGAKTNGNIRAAGTISGRNIRSSDWFFKSWQGMLMNEGGNPLAMVVNPQPFSAAHFAVWPEHLVEPLILAGTSARGACPACDAPCRRVVERGLTAHDGETNSQYETGTNANNLARLRQAARERGGEYINGNVTTGWKPTCDCQEIISHPSVEVPFEPGGDTGYWAPEPQPCVVCDPFHGSGTTGKVAARLGRSYIGVDLSEKYLGEITDARLGDGVQMELSW